MLACCAGEPYSLTELLVNPEDERAIQLITVDSVWMDGNERFWSSATVDYVFKNPGKTTQIKIRSGQNNSSAGGMLLRKHHQYLLVSGSRDGITYGGFVCDKFSTILNGPLISTKQANNLEMIKYYFDLVNKQYTGLVQIKKDSILFAKGQMVNGIPDGQWKHYDYRIGGNNNLYLKSEEHYNLGLYDGQQIRYEYNRKDLLPTKSIYSKGKLMKRAAYRKGQVEDYIGYETTYQYFPEYTLTTSFNKYNEDTPANETATITFNSKAKGIHQTRCNHGVSKIFNKEGVLLQQGEYWFGAKVGFWQYYFENGTIEREEDYDYPERPKELFTVFHPDGSIRMQGQMIDQLPEGKWKSYHSSGHLAQVSFYKNGKLEGETKSYYSKTGNLATITQYKEDKPTGLYFRQHENNQLKSITGQYKDGEKTGKWTEYYNDGSLFLEEHFLHGKRNGSCKKYNRNGQVISACEFKNDSFHNEYIRFDETGFILESGHYNEGQKIGIWRSYNKHKDYYTILDYGNQLRTFKEYLNLRVEEGIVRTFEDQEGNQLTFEEIKNRRK